MAPHISLNAIIGVYNYQTIGVSDIVGTFKFHIFIDSGSTHNFLDSGTAKKLECEIRKTFPLQVTVVGEVVNWSWG
nr:retrotransposable element Tf2 [Tanacetum cinerariifolium]